MPAGERLAAFRRRASTASADSTGRRVAAAVRQPTLLLGCWRDCAHLRGVRVVSLLDELSRAGRLARRLRHPVLGAAYLRQCVLAARPRRHRYARPSHRRAWDHRVSTHRQRDTRRLRALIALAFFLRMDVARSLFVVRPPGGPRGTSPVALAVASMAALAPAQGSVYLSCGRARRAREAQAHHQPDPAHSRFRLPDRGCAHGLGCVRLHRRSTGRRWPGRSGRGGREARRRHPDRVLSRRTRSGGNAASRLGDGGPGSELGRSPGADGYRRAPHPRDSCCRPSAHPRGVPDARGL